MITIFMNHYNEHFLLPYWLRWHYPMVDHGVILDYGSDQSCLDIVKELAPTWEVVQSRNPMFDATENDIQIMELEAKQSSSWAEESYWKIALNTTEFLFHPNLEEYLCQTAYDHIIGWKSLTMVGNRPPVEQIVGCKESIHLPLQYSRGYYNPDARVRGNTRWMHRLDMGEYSYPPGRHWIDTPHGYKQEQHPELLLLWFGWAPYNQIKDRKLQIQNKIPESDKAKNFGHQHLVTSEQLDNQFHQELIKAHSLFDIPEYAKNYKGFIDGSNT